MSLRGLVLYEKRDLENTSQLGSFHKAPPFDGENNNGQQSGLAEESQTETEARQLRSAATKGSRHECPRRLGAPAPSFEGKQIPLQKYRTLTPARAPGWVTDPTPGRVSSKPGPPDRRAVRGRDFSDETSLGAKTRSWRGAGRGRAPTRTFHARSQLPAQSGLCLGPLCPRPREGAAEPPEGGRARRGREAGSAKAPSVPSRARLSGRMAGTRRQPAPAEPSRGAGPAPGPGAQRGRLGRGAGSPRGGLRPQGRRPGLAAAWAVARPGRAKDAPRLLARAPAAYPTPPAKGWRQDSWAERASPEARAATAADEARGE